ncbi:MAG: tRNA (adenosine(37)-N6)-dimethylallyltransferase MiaA [Acidobacteria bacterium]|nr:tRNA (adenosine(37)-N6)-dimethylallyltransferase MiaA [Acidobacteriota bacterium]
MKDGKVEEYPLVAIVGPTAAGKSALALYLAERLDGEIVNYDSVQIYRGFDIGTGKLPAAERRGIPHHLVDSLDPGEDFTAGDFRREALKVLGEIRLRAKLPILVGGTGLYLRALLLGIFDGPPRSERLRARLRRLADRRGREFVHRLLERLDPASAARIDPQDLQKVIRAVEVCVLARESMSALHARGREPLQGFRCVKIGLNPARIDLNARINQRVEQMFASGLREEVRCLLARPDARQIKALGAIGYRQVAAALAGEMTWQDAVGEMQATTRQYAKRQMTWFRRESEVTWFPAFGDDPEVQAQVLSSVNARFASKGREGVDSPRPSPLF